MPARDACAVWLRYPLDALSQSTHQHRVVMQRFFLTGSEPLPGFEQPRLAVQVASDGAEHQRSRLVPQRTLIGAKPGSDHLKAPNALPAEKPILGISAQSLPLGTVDRRAASIEEERLGCPRRIFSASHSQKCGAYPGQQTPDHRPCGTPGPRGPINQARGVVAD